MIDGNKVKVRIRFRGREITYPEIALNDLKQVAESLSDVAINRKGIGQREATIIKHRSQPEGKKASFRITATGLE